MTPSSDPLHGEAIWDQLIHARSIPAETRRRLSPYLSESVPPHLIPDYEAQGWVVDKRLKTKARMRKEKPHDRAFERRVWATFARLQFMHLNRDRAFRLACGDAAMQTPQINVFAADDEVAIVIECKSSELIRAPVQEGDRDDLRAERRPHPAPAR